MSLTAPALVTGSELVTVDSDRAGDWQRALATVGGRLPVGWDGAGERSGGLSGYDLVLAASRTLSALGWLLLCAGQEALAQPIDQAHEEAVLGCRWSSPARSGPSPPRWSAMGTTRPASPGPTPTSCMAPWPPPTTASSRSTPSRLPSSRVAHLRLPPAGPPGSHPAGRGRAGPALGDAGYGRLVCGDRAPRPRAGRDPAAVPAAFRDRRLLGQPGAAVTADLHKLSAGRADYYVREVARDHEEYLSGNGESPRGVLGAGSTALGKQGSAPRRSSGGCSPGATPTPASSSAGRLAAMRCRPGPGATPRQGRRPPVCPRRPAHQPSRHAGPPGRRGGRGDLPGRAGRDPHGPRRGEACRGLRAGGGRVHSPGQPGRGPRCPTPTWSSSTAPKGPTEAGAPSTAGTCSPTARPPTRSTGPPIGTS